MAAWFFIARRLVRGDKASFSRPILRLAVLSIALGITVMIIAVAIVTGFQNEIREKVIGFGAHIRISSYDSNNSWESAPVSVDQDFYPGLAEEDGIAHIQVFATKAGILRSGDQIEGVVLKGVGQDFYPDFFNDKIVEGSMIRLLDSGRSEDLLISRIIASRLRLSTGDAVQMFFVREGQPRPSVRKFKVSGIYDTGLEEFDRMFVFGDIRHIQRLNMWDSTQVGGFEVFIDRFADLDHLTQKVYHSIGYDLDCKSVKQLHPQIFDWLKFQDTNVAVILIMMVIVAAINMMSALLILILEKTRLIGILKSMGMSNWSIRRLFLMQAAHIILRGLFWGNLIALALCLIQIYTGAIQLDPASYYVKEVPVNLDLISILLVNAGTVIVCMFVLVMPTYVVTRITPVKALRIT